MELFALSDREPGRLLAVTDADEHLSCGDLSAASEALARAIGGHVLVFLLCENTSGTLLGYLGCLRCGAVPLLLDAHIAPGLLKGLAETYCPAFYYAPCDLPKETRAVLPQAAPVLELHGSLLLSGSVEGPAIHPDLALLLTTSGSTGSPKLVRLSGKNLDANARSIAEYLNLGEDERPITTLPMSYSYGMSIVNSHLLVGAPLLLTRHSVMERSFWDRVDREGATSLAGVPYTYQMFHRLGLISMNLPRLRTLTQAGGKLSLELHREFAAWAMGTGRQFFVMYGQTEAAPRMGYLPANRAVEKCGSMGVPIPGGSFWLEDADGAEIKAPDATGELVYRGDNVAMGTPNVPKTFPRAMNGAVSCAPETWHTGIETVSITSWDAKSDLSNSLAIGSTWTRWSDYSQPASQMLNLPVWGGTIFWVSIQSAIPLLYRVKR